MHVLSTCSAYIYFIDDLYSSSIFVLGCKVYYVIYVELDHFSSHLTDHKAEKALQLTSVTLSLA